MVQLSDEDFEFNIEITQNHIKLILEYFKNIWPDSIIVNKIGNIIKIKNVLNTDLFVDKRFIIYKNSDYFQLWENCGYSDSLSITAILIIFSESKLYITYGYDKKQSNEFIYNLINFLTFNQILFSKLPNIERKHAA